MKAIGLLLIGFLATACASFGAVFVPSTTTNLNNDASVSLVIVTNGALVDTSTALARAVAVTNIGIYPTNLANAQISASANIDATKLGTGIISTTELNTLNNASGNLQAQINSIVVASGTNATFVNGVQKNFPNLTNSASILIDVADDTNVTFHATNITAIAGDSATDFFSSGTLESARLGSGSAFVGAILTPWVDTNGTVTLTWRKAPQVWELAEPVAVLLATGTGASPNSAVDEMEHGLYSITTGTGTNQTSGYRLAGSMISLTTNSLAVEWRIRLPDALSTDVDGYELHIGLTDQTGDGEATDGAYFYYLHSVSNGVWTAKTARNSVRTFASGAASTVTVTAAKWYNLRLEGTKTLVNFWVSGDDGATWTWIGYSTTNLPTTTSFQTGVNAYIRKVGGSGGTATREAYLGRLSLWTPRHN